MALTSELKIAREEFLARINAVDPASPTAKAELAALKSEYQATGNTVAARRESLVNNFTSLAEQGAGFFNKSQVQAIVNQVTADIKSLNQSPIPGALETLDKQISQADKPQEPAPPAASAADAVATSGEGATQNPPAPPETAAGRVTPTQAAALAGGTPAADSGTNAPTRTLAQTQNVPDSGDYGPPPWPSDTNREKPTAGGRPGAGSANEDQSGTRSATKIILDKFSDKITPRNNVLDQYASYTYSISWYLLQPGAYQKILQSKKATLQGFQLLMQSGGAPPAENIVTETELVNIGGRNARFPLDYYLDNLEINSAISGGRTGSAHNVTTFKFTVTEPNGITLLNNLSLAVRDLYPSGMKYEWAQYGLIIRFYGYDDQGNLVQARQPGTMVTDRSAVVEKFYPFIITGIQFRVASRLVEYTVEAAALPQVVGASTARGTVKEQMRLSGSTVSDLLGGFSDASAQAAANTATDGRPSTTDPAPGADLLMKQQAAMAAGTDPNAVNPDGMAFGGGGN